MERILENDICLPISVTDEVDYSNYRLIQKQIEIILRKHNYSEKFIRDFLERTKRFIPNYEDYEVNIYRAIEIILNSGGVPVLAHPNRIKLNDDELEKLIKKLASFGLQGLETSYSHFSQEEFTKYSNQAKKYNLLESVGSDFHFPTLSKNVIIGSGINDNLLKTDCSLKQFILERRS